MKLEPIRDGSVGLLVSVRDATEAEAALKGGADLIDIKEPRSGSLGKADDSAIADIVKRVAGRRPMSAALGELKDWNGQAGVQIDPGVSLLKIGLSGLGSRSNWRNDLVSFRDQMAVSTGGGLVFVAYADWRRADAPSVDDIADFAIRTKAPAFLIDTWDKDGSTLLDWLSLGQLRATCDRFRHAEIPVALAGSLGRDRIRQLASIRPTWLAVRGAACIGGRDGTIDSERVRNLVAELNHAPQCEGKP